MACNACKGGGTYFNWGGGGQRQKGHYNVKKGTNDGHADNITNVFNNGSILVDIWYICIFS